MSAVPGGYVALLRLPGAAVLLCLATAARVVFGVLPLALLLHVVEERASYADAGAVVGLYALSAGLLGPARSRLVDRLGPRAALTGLTVAFGVLLTALVVGVTAPLPVVAAIGLLAGCSPPPVGPTMRTLWRRLTADAPEAVRRAYALDAVTEEGAFVAGPVIAAIAVTGLGAPVVLHVGSGVLSMAVIALAVRAAPLMPAGPMRSAARTRPSVERRVRVLLPMAAAGLVLAGVELAAVALVTRAWGTSAVGVPGTALSAASVIAGLLYGRGRWPGRPHTQACILAAAGATAALGAAAVMGRSVVAFVVVTALVGATVGPALIATYLSVDEAWDDLGSEATAWVNATFNSALAAGTALAGALIDRRSPAAAVAVVGALALVLTAAAASAHPTPKGRVRTSSQGPPR